MVLELCIGTDIYFFPNGHKLTIQNYSFVYNISRTDIVIWIYTLALGLDEANITVLYMFSYVPLIRLFI